MPTEEVLKLAIQRHLNSTLTGIPRRPGAFSDLAAERLSGALRASRRVATPSETATLRSVDSLTENGI